MHAHTHMHTHAHSHTRTHACTHKHTRSHAGTHACTHACPHSHAHTHTHSHTCAHMHIHTTRSHVHSHAHTACAHTHSHTCTHVHAETHTHTLMCAHTHRTPTEFRLLEESANFLRCDQGKYLGPFPPGCSFLVACVVLNVNSLLDSVCLMFQGSLCLNGSALGRDRLPCAWDSLSAQRMALLPPFPAVSVPPSRSTCLCGDGGPPPSERALQDA